MRRHKIQFLNPSGLCTRRFATFWSLVAPSFSLAPFRLLDRMPHFDKVPVQPATLQNHWRSIDSCVSRGNPAGAAFQLFKVTQSAPAVCSDSGKRCVDGLCSVRSIHKHEAAP